MAKTGGTDNPSSLRRLTATILFADIVGSLELANYLDALAYEKVLREWHEVATAAVRLCAERELCRLAPGDVSIRGDELCVLFHSGDLRQDITGALTVAAEVKVGWLLSRANARRMGEGKPPLEVGVGLHTGVVVETRRQPPVGDSPAETVLEGFNISIAKRVEECSRRGRFSKILLSQTTYKYLEGLGLEHECHYLGRQEFQGMAQGWPLYEVKACESFRTMAASRDARALKRLRACAEADPHNVWALAMLLEAHMYRGDTAQCLAVAERLIAVDDSLAYGHLGKGFALMRMGKSAESAAELDAALARGARGVLVHVFRAGAYGAEGRLDEAEAHCREALRLDPNYPGAFYNLGCIALLRGDHDTALQRFQEAVEKGGDRVRRLLQRDKDVDPLRGDPRFAALL